jgi:Uma2 family endonuclease
MSAILELPEVRERVLRWSVDEYEHLVEAGVIHKNAELLRGIVIERVSKSPLHRALAKWIYDQFQLRLPAGLVTFLESPLRLADSEPEPDVSVVRGSTDEFRRRHPTTAELVIEVAVSSAALDRENAVLYAEAGITEYWIVLGPERMVEVYRDPLNGVYRSKRLYRQDEILACAAFPELGFRLNDLFAE